MGSDAGGEKLLPLVEAALKKHFSTSEFDGDKIHACISEALTLKENMRMKFREKSAAQSAAVVYLRYLDSGCYWPLLRVTGSDGKLLLEQDLPQMRDLNLLGTIAPNAKSVTIRPRKNAYTQAAEPLTFGIGTR